MSRLDPEIKFEVIAPRSGESLATSEVYLFAEQDYNLGDFLSLKDLRHKLSEEFKLYQLASALPDLNSVDQFAAKLGSYFEGFSTRKMTAIGIGAGGTLVQDLAIRYPKLVRRVILINATTRICPSLGTRMIDWIESHLPLGLPLRKLSKAFDSRPELHRVRCPALIVTLPRATHFETAQAELLVNAIPNAYAAKVTAVENVSDKLFNLIDEFQNVSIKCPATSARQVKAQTGLGKEFYSDYPQGSGV
ncbi:alpha/beta hydrolase [bacterium]|nr:alpha/beta hydrolase [bacterium]